ncbi:MAG: hypothetical protein A2015_17370 [Spirochaetes bacterium GWF1_31_7]|nr:MAG: hypothetical protein A2Y30_14555 [Spirochaetes bacterium GWE1_32_154]OHD46867.1 MAG: hypothetical protein A2015_17370 [Spirochaetes bacterium GWF1_31_7]OHD50176.1 MAG: hypothetical protein A2Y29_12600 [Spirochaetes bacterium GWE2_31_10]
MGLKKLKEDGKFTYNDYIQWKDSEDWEIIGGVAYNMAPSPGTTHQGLSSVIHGELYQYLKNKPCRVFFELDVVLSEGDVVKPDIIVVCDKTKIKDKHISGAPDLIVEILSPSTAKKDKNDKYALYKSSGVKEYWIVDPHNQVIDVHNFTQNTFKMYFNEDDITDNYLEPSIFGGDYKLDVNEIFKGDSEKNT